MSGQGIRNTYWGMGGGVFFLSVPFLRNKKNAFCVLTFKANRLTKEFLFY